MNKNLSLPKLLFHFFRWYCHAGYQKDIKKIGWKAGSGRCHEKILSISIANPSTRVDLSTPLLVSFDVNDRFCLSINIALHFFFGSYDPILCNPMRCIILELNPQSFVCSQRGLPPQDHKDEKSSDVFFPAIL